MNGEGVARVTEDKVSYLIAFYQEDTAVVADICELVFGAAESNRAVAARDKVCNSRRFDDRVSVL